MKNDDDEIENNENKKSSLIDINASNYVNDPNIEYHWAVKAYQSAEIHFNLLVSLDTKYLKLTRIDEKIYAHFRELFPELNVSVVDVDQLKSADSKEKWRPFCEFYKEKVDDYNMATLLRLNAADDYTEENTIIVPKIQFNAVEIARNREGLNATVAEKFKHHAQMFNYQETE